MLTIGSEVIVKTTKQTGVIMKWDSENPGFLKIKIWDIDLNKYRDISAHPINLAEIENPLYHQMGNEDDKEGMDDTMNILIDLALMTNDKAAFDKLMLQKKKGRKSRKQTEAERSRIKISSVVCDLNGFSIGIVTGYCKVYSDTLLVSCWSPAHATMITYRRAYHLVKLVENKKLIAFMNDMVNHKDYLFRRMHDEVVRYLAVESNDRTWFESACEKETSDGA